MVYFSHDLIYALKIENDDDDVTELEDSEVIYFVGAHALEEELLCVSSTHAEGTYDIAQ